ncbi:MAG: hypothetical protein HN351_09975 [Deltaproteobacteria bacterium]|nr:hypothetical protein [Deltaproteobacteria bacterium]
MRVYLLFLLVLPALLGGCYPKSLNYSPGWGTRTIEGTVLEENAKVLESQPFIIVLEYYSNFVKFENESPLYAPKARVVFPDKNGNFRISFDLKATAIDLTFVASAYSMQRFRFRRQLGVGELRYDASLPRSEVWQHEFILQIAPFLENFILEQRYKMPDSQQLFLGNWLAEERRRFAEEKGN